MTIVGRFLPIGRCCSSVEQGARLGINLETCRSQHALRTLLIGAVLPISTAGEQSHPTQIVTVLKVNNGQEVLVEINREGRPV